ncbi:hypothetical protein ABZP36_009252 [Zizania latifolia]
MEGGAAGPAVLAVSVIVLVACTGAADQAAGEAGAATARPDASLLCVSECGTCPTTCTSPPTSVLPLYSAPPPPPPADVNDDLSPPPAPTPPTPSSPPPPKSGGGGHFSSPPSSSNPYYYFYLSRSGRLHGGAATIYAALILSALLPTITFLT